jgi:hypothetical protein
MNQFLGGEIFAANPFLRQAEIYRRASIGCERDEHPE